MHPVRQTTPGPAAHHPGGHRRRHRPWYKKAWQSVNDRNRVVRFALLLLLVVAAVLLGILVTQINLAASHRRGMNETPAAPVGTLSRDDVGAWASDHDSRLSDSTFQRSNLFTLVDKVT